MIISDNILAFAKQHAINPEWVNDITNHIFTDQDFYVHKLMTEFGSLVSDLEFVNAGLGKPFGISKPNPPIDIDREIVQIMCYELKYPKPLVALLCVMLFKYAETITQYSKNIQPNKEPFSYMREPI